MQEERKPYVLKRLSYIEGHVAGIRKMVEEDKSAWTSCVKPTRCKAIEKLEALILEGHLRTCVPEGMKGDREEEVIQELVQLYAIAGNPWGAPFHCSRGESAATIVLEAWSFIEPFILEAV